MLKISTARPPRSTAIVFFEQPFHSLSMMPQTFEKMTFRLISMHQLKVSSTGEATRKPLPRLSPKNWLYHSKPARQQNRALLSQRLPCL